MLNVMHHSCLVSYSRALYIWVLLKLLVFKSNIFDNLKLACVHKWCYNSLYVNIYFCRFISIGDVNLYVWSLLVQLLHMARRLPSTIDKCTSHADVAPDMIKQLGSFCPTMFCTLWYHSSFIVDARYVANYEPEDSMMIALLVYKKLARIRVVTLSRCVVLVGFEGLCFEDRALTFLLCIYDRGEPAVSWTGWSWEITGWSSRLQENYRSF
jgi:hypothetical protein